MLTLAEWRRAKNISQSDMAKACGVHTNTYQHWEKKPSNISIINAEKIADRLGIAVSDIIFSP